jgi:hypothetical protein
LYVKLSPAQIAESKELGELRYKESRRSGAKDKYGLKGDYTSLIEGDINGACGELAASIAYGRTWNKTINTYKSIADIGKFTDVKSAARGPSLILRDDDPVDRYYVLVIGCLPCPEFRVVGHIAGGNEVRVDRWLRNPNNRTPAWFLPQSLLTPPPEHKGDVSEKKKAWARYWCNPGDETLRDAFSFGLDV